MKVHQDTLDVPTRGRGLTDVSRKVQAVVDAYNKRHSQHSVFRIEHAVCVGA